MRQRLWPGQGAGDGEAEVTGSGQAVGDETVEGRIAARVREQPAQMGAAGPAKDDLPPVCGEPGEFAARFPLRGDAGRQPETTNGKGNAGGIEKGVIVAAIDLDRLVAVGDCRTADAADDGVLFLRPLDGPGLRPSPSCRGGTTPSFSEAAISAPIARPCPDTRQQLPAPCRRWCNARAGCPPAAHAPGLCRR